MDNEAESGDELTFDGAAAPSLTIGKSLYEDVTLDNVEQTWSGPELESVRVGMTLKKERGAPSFSVQNLSIRKRRLESRPEAGVVPENPLDYELLNQLGEGGMGVVYQARQACIDRTIAVKMIRGDHKSNEIARNKFLSEATVTGDLDHPNIVPIHDLGETDDGNLFYAMKHVQGVSWMETIDNAELSDNLDILMRVADAVAFAHAHGVIHRDLKPENVMLGEYGEVLLMDWGLAASVTDAGKASELDENTALAGTPAYMAPEMATGDVSRIGLGSDIYLLGGILYEIVTGQRPHGGRNVKRTLYEAAQNHIVATEKKGELVEIALKAMASDPSDRYATVKEFQQAIHDYRSHQESVALTERGRESLDAAAASGDYQDYAKALFAFCEAHELWFSNETAKRGAVEAALAYAACAEAHGDLDLAASLLDANEPAHTELLGRVREDRTRRAARTRRLRTLKYATAVLGLGVIGILAFAIYSIREQGDRNARALRKQTLDKVRQRLRNNVDIAWGVVESNMVQAESPAYLQQRYGAALRNVVTLAFDVLQRHADLVKEGKLGASEAQHLARERIREMRYDNGTGYFWINDMGDPVPRMIMHPIKPQLDGTVLDNPAYNCALGKDANLFVAARDVCQANGSGFVDYVWPKPGPNGLIPNVEKLSYVQAFEPWGWIVGTGIYIDDARQDAITKSMDDLRAMRFDSGTGYFWINDMAEPMPSMVMHPILPALDGMRLDDPKYNCVDGTGENLFSAAVTVCRRDGAGTVRYLWPKPTADGLIPDAPKLSYVRGYEPLGWVIGCGAYVDDIEAMVDARKREMRAQIDTLIQSMLVAFFVVAAGAGLVILYVERFAPAVKTAQ